VRDSEIDRKILLEISCDCAGTCDVAIPTLQMRDSYGLPHTRTRLRVCNPSFKHELSQIWLVNRQLTCEQRKILSNEITSLCAKVCQKLDSNWSIRAEQAQSS
jgi:hypothetical protein